MIAQYTAAALVSENKVLAHPASVDSIPTSAGQEDNVSMGTIQGIDFWKTPGVGTNEAHDFIRKYLPFIEQVRILYEDIEIARELINSGKIVKAVEKVVKPK